EPFSTLPRVRILHGLPGAAPSKETVSLQWKNADLLEAAIPVAGRETILNTVEISRQAPVTLPAACLPYSPEFEPDQPGRGVASLAQLAVMTGGRERIEIPKIWSELPVKSRYVELAPWLLVLGTLLFLLEILERRTGWVSRLFRIQPSPVAEVAEESQIIPVAPSPKPVFPWLIRKPMRKPMPSAIAKPTMRPADPVVPDQPSPASEKPVEPVSAIDALRKARERANRRTDRES
ncbi:MAG: hypothetical protein WCJ07_14850, partial [Verrucomicrobiota bacterium]